MSFRLFAGSKIRVIREIRGQYKQQDLFFIVHHFLAILDVQAISCGSGDALAVQVV